MSRRYSFIDPAADSRWQHFADQHPRASIYHHFLWKLLIEKTFGYTPLYLIAESAGDISAALPLFLVKSRLTGRRVVGVPFADYADPLTTNDDSLAVMIAEVAQRCERHNISFIELRVRGPQANWSSPTFTSISQNKNHFLELNAPRAEIEKRFHHSCIVRSIRKAQKSKLTTFLANRPGQFSRFYDLVVRTRRRHGLPPLPFRFFRNLWDLFQPQKMLTLHLASLEGREVAGVLSLHYREFSYYLVGGSLPQYHSYRPNHLLLWEAIQWAHREGRRYFDFGRTHISNQGLLDFKRRWGTTEQDLINLFHRLDDSEEVPMNRRGQQEGMINQLIRHMPLPVLKWGGNLLYRHLG